MGTILRRDEDAIFNNQKKILLLDDKFVRCKFIRPQIVEKTTSLGPVRQLVRSWTGCWEQLGHASDLTRQTPRPLENKPALAFYQPSEQGLGIFQCNLSTRRPPS